jgi:paraquat-inducible protein B
MTTMFKGAIAFNQPLNGWDVSSVECMYEMFKGATAFNQNLDTWKISSRCTMNRMPFSWI